MTTTPVVMAQDGPQITVNDLLKNPLTIPRRIINDISKQGFIADRLLRKGGSAVSGAALYYVSTPMYPDTDDLVVADGGEIPVAQTSVGNPKVAQSTLRAQGIRITKRMRDRNQMDLVTQGITQVKNGMTRSWDQTFMAALTTASGLSTVAASAKWDSGTEKIRKDLAKAMQKVTDAADDNGGIFGWVPDTLVVDPTTLTNFLGSDDLAKVYIGNVANQNAQLDGKLGQQLFGLDLYLSRGLTAGTALVLQRGVIGFIADERPLQATPTYYREEIETWRSDVSRASLFGLDQPTAGCVLTNVR